MPLYSDANYYYTGGSSQLFAPYYPSGVYSIPSVSSAYAPYPSSTLSSYSRTLSTSSYVSPLSPTTSRTPTYTSHGLNSRYQPKLSTIGETSTLITSARRGGGLLPLTRIPSPKISSYSPTSSTTLHSKYIPPRPININTADIDVSSVRHSKLHDEKLQREEKQRESNEKETVEENSAETNKRNSVKNETTANSVTSEQSDATQPKQMRSTIRRNRPVVRLSTVRARNKDAKMNNYSEVEKPIDNQINESIPVNEEKIGWRQKLAEDLALLTPNQTKKSPGQLLRERFLIADKESANNKTENIVADQLIDEVLVEVDAVNQICHVSLPSGPTFHDICEDISSDKIDDDLNAGALRKRASIIHEQEQDLLNQLQQSASGTFQLIHLERRGSHDSTVNETQPTTRKSKRLSKSKKVKHKITAVVDIQNGPLTPILQEKDEELSPKPKISYNVDTMEEHHQIHKVFKLPKKKRESIKLTQKTKKVELPTGFFESIPKVKRDSKTKISKTKEVKNKQSIFTFDEKSIREQQEAENQKIIQKESLQSIKENVEEKDLKSEPKSAQTEVKTEKSMVVTKEVLPKLEVCTESDKVKSKEKLLNSKKTEQSETPVATPKPIKKIIKKSDSSEDFWSHIGTRETIYMANRKNMLQETFLPKIETMSEPSNMLESLEKHNFEMQQMTHKKELAEKTSIPKIEILTEASSIVKPAQEEEKKKCTNKPKENEKTLKADTNEMKSRSAKIESADSSTKVTDLTTTKKLPTSVAKTTNTTNKDTITTPGASPSQEVKGAIVPKIQIGKEAKSPEKQQKNLAKSTLTTVITSTTTTTTTAKNEDIYQNSKQEKKVINNTNTVKNANLDSKNVLTTTKNAETDHPKIEKTKSTTTTTTMPETKLAQLTTKTMKECEIKSIAEVQNKSDSTKTKLQKDEKIKGTTNKESPSKNAEINKAQTSPINADGFITVAPLRTITTASSPTNAKNKNASPNKNLKTTTTATTDKVKMTTNATNPTKTATPKIGKATAAGAEVESTIVSNNQTAKTTSTIAATAATTTTITTTTTATINCDDQKLSDKSHDSNNLSKFATVLDLAQCLRDVDADLEDYIPSSAENSDDEDDSSFYCSSVDGCENLSASMKKKLKEKKRKEKQAQEARFDPHKKIKIDTTNKCYVKDEAPRYPLVATPRPLWKREKIIYPEESSDDSDSDESGSTEETEDSETCSSTSEEEYEATASSANVTAGSSLASTDNSAIIRMSTCSNDSGFEGGTAPSSPKKMLGE